MRSYFDRELNILNKELISMASLVEERIQSAMQALINQDIDLAKSIVNSDYDVDSMEKEIENRCLKLLLRQQPVAKDLRLISSILKIITDLERIGDQAVDIAEITLLLGNEEYIKKLVDIPEMGKFTIEMVTTSINAFVDKDLTLAKKVIALDDKVDCLFDIIKDELVDLIVENKKNAQQAINFLMISKYLERIGDHAENIAEWVIFSITGEHVEK